MKREDFGWKMILAFSLFCYCMAWVIKSIGGSFDVSMLLMFLGMLACSTMHSIRALGKASQDNARRIEKLEKELRKLEDELRFQKLERAGVLVESPLSTGARPDAIQTGPDRW